jgi:hypothetical protein
VLAALLLNAERESRMDLDVPCAQEKRARYVHTADGTALDVVSVWRRDEISRFARLRRRSATISTAERLRARLPLHDPDL